MKQFCVDYLLLDDELDSTIYNDIIVEAEKKPLVPAILEQKHGCPVDIIIISQLENNSSLRQLLFDNSEELSDLYNDYL